MHLRAAALVLFASLASGAEPRRVAVTFDDLPVVSVVNEGDVRTERDMTDRLLAALRKAAVPAVGFVNEYKLHRRGKIDENRIELLRRWLAAGMELGNHTYGHADMNTVALASYEADVLAGEALTRPLSREAHVPLRFFRHPFLHAGRDLAQRRSFETFLGSHGYRVAPVTIDDADWIFAKALVNADAAGDAALHRRILQAFVPYLESKVAYWEAQSRLLFGREIPQVLLLHASSLNAEMFGAVGAMLRRRGYAFVTLDSALSDPAYASEDRYVGPGGISWLHRWALTRSGGALIVPGEPRCPSFVMTAAGAAEE